MDNFLSDTWPPYGSNYGRCLLFLQMRLDAMLYVGLTAEHKESATMFANVVGSQVISQLRDANFSTGTLADNQSGLCFVLLLIM